VPWKQPNREHATDARTSRQQAAIGFAGRSGWSRMGPADDAELGRQLRAATWEVGNRTSTTGVRRDRLVLAAMRNRFGAAAVERFGAENIVALLRVPGLGMCNWCAARVLHATASPPKPMPTPTPGLSALLGAQCSRCKVAFAAREVADRERDHLDAVTAAGLRPQAAASVRTPEQLARRATAARTTEQARCNPAPTGVLWSADQGEPAGLTAAARAAARRRWPTDAGADGEVCPCQRCETRRGRR
jgi:hypothetical protein